jgi:hypothetical protein
MKHIQTYEKKEKPLETVGNFIYDNFLKEDFYLRKNFSDKEHSDGIYQGAYYYFSKSYVNTRIAQFDKLKGKEIITLAKLAEFIKPYGELSLNDAVQGTGVWEISVSFTDKNKLDQLKNTKEWKDWILKIDAEKYNL